MAAQTARPSPPAALRKPNEKHVEWLLRRIWDRVNVRNMHFMGAIVGEEGAGKSHTAMKISDAVDSTFTADRVIFDVVRLLKILEAERHDPGNFYVLDEAGVQFGKRTWHDRSQILGNQVLQIVRDENLGLIFTVPTLGDLDSQTQRRLQAFYELTEKEDGEYVRGLWKFMDPDRTDTTGKIYKKYPRRIINGHPVRITDFAFTPPSPELVEPYTERKAEFQRRHYRATIREYEGDPEDEDDGRTLDDVVDDILNGRLPDVVDEHGTTGAPFINKDLIRHEFNLSHSDSRAVKKLVERRIDDLETAVE